MCNIAEIQPQYGSNTDKNGKLFELITFLWTNIQNNYKFI